MSNFNYAFTNFIRPNEGGYAFVPQDRGGETYAGIARNFWENWEGWTFVDFEKNKFPNGKIPHNHHFQSIEYLVRDFYLDMWNRYKLSEINDRDISTFLFDYIIHSGAGNAVRAIQRIIGVNPDAKIGTITINAINTKNPKQVYNALFEQRKQFLENIVKNDPSQNVFLRGWMNRLAKFPGVGLALSVFPIVVLIIIIVLLLTLK